MSKLNAALLVGATLLLAGASHVQAADIRFPHWDIGTIAGLGMAPDLMLDPDRRIPAIDLSGDDDGDDDGGIEPGIKPDHSRDGWSSEYAENPEDGGDWSSEKADNPNDDQWHASSASQEPTKWTMETASQDDP